MAGSHHETYLQIQIVQLLALDFLPENLIFYAVPNGANLPKKENSRKPGVFYSPEAHKLKKMGLLPGVSDLVFHWPVTPPDGETRMETGMIELKVGDNWLEPEQIVFRDRVKAMGGKYAIARRYEKVRDTLIGWGVKCEHRAHL